jgi:hypothetical protein
MAVIPLAELDQVARRDAADRHDAYSERALARAYEEYVARRRTPLGPLRLRAGGREFSSFYELGGDPASAAASIELRLDPPAAPGAPWEFLRPFERMVFDTEGGAEVYPLGGAPPIRVIARFLLREHYLPRTRAEEDRAAAGGARVTIPTHLRTLQQGLLGSRSYGILPFSVSVLAYYPDERVIYELDLIRSLLLTDPRAGRLAAGRRVRRSSRVSWYVDRLAGRGEMPLLASRCLSVLVESHGLTAIEMSHVFGGVRELVDSALQGLAARGLVTFDRRTGVYRPRLDAFMPVPSPDSGGTVAEPMPAGSNPALRTSVQELIAAADARATCPLCGSPLSSDAKGILCAKCAAEVGGV